MPTWQLIRRFLSRRCFGAGWPSSQRGYPKGADNPLCALLIRPDGYVAWAADTFEVADEERLRSALQRWFGSPDEGKTGQPPSVARMQTVT